MALKGKKLTETKDKLKSMGHKTVTGLSGWNVSCINRVFKIRFIVKLLYIERLCL